MKLKQLNWVKSELPFLKSPTGSKFKFKHVCKRRLTENFHRETKFILIAKTRLSWLIATLSHVLFSADFLLISDIADDFPEPITESLLKSASPNASSVASQPHISVTDQDFKADPSNPPQQWTVTERNRTLWSTESPAIGSKKSAKSTLRARRWLQSNHPKSPAIPIRRFSDAAVRQACEMFSRKLLEPAEDYVQISSTDLRIPNVSRKSLSLSSASI